MSPLQSLSKSQKYQLVLEDVALAAAIVAYDEGARAPEATPYVPGRVREDWLARTADPELRRRVLALASAAAGSLQWLPGPDLAAAAEKYGLKIPASLAEEIAEHFNARRSAVMTYDR